MAVRRGFGGVLAPTLTGGVIAAVADLIYAVIAYDIALAPVLRVIAGGWLGPAAGRSGVGGSLLGLASHFGILIVAAGLYVLAARAAPILRRQPIPFGLAYGAVIYLVMNYVVVPLSAVPARAHPPWSEQAPHLIAHMVLVGVPIALACWSFGRGARARA